MKLFQAVGQMLDRAVQVVDAVGQAIVTTAESADIIAQAGKDMANLAKNTTDQMLKEQQLEMRKEILLLTRELEKEVALTEEGELVTL